MATLEKLYPGIPYSPPTTLAADISATDATIAVADGTVLPEAPNKATIGTRDNAETIIYGTKTDGILGNVQRGVEDGGVGKEWAAGMPIANYYTAGERNNTITNFGTLNKAKTEPPDVRTIAGGLADDNTFTPSDTGTLPGTPAPVSIVGAVNQLAALIKRLTGKAGYLSAPKYNLTQIDEQIASKANLTQLWNPNLLDNWDFTNPVNQRGLTSYATPGYTIDRWKIDYAQTPINNIVYGKGIEITFGNNGFIYQIIEHPGLYSGLTVTSSVIIKNLTGSIRIYINYVADGVAGSIYGDTISSDGIAIVTGTLPEKITYLQLCYRRWGTNVATATIIRNKFERGSISTIANDPPMNYGMELAKCQRYQYAPVTNTCVRAVFIKDDTIDFLMYAPVIMRIVSNISISGLQVYTLSAVNIPGFTFEVIYTKGPIRIRATKTAHGLTDASLVVATLTIFDANL